MRIDKEKHVKPLTKEIGSYFSISPVDLKKCNDLNYLHVDPGNDVIYLSTCRSAIGTVLSRLDNSNKKALLPAFTCHAVVEPFVKNGYEVFPYPVSSDFSTDLEKFIAFINDIKPSVILLHDYFGFKTNKTICDSGVLDELRSKGIKVIVDLTQSMFSSYQQLSADFYVGSIRKWMGIPDGAFLKNIVSKNSLKEDTELENNKLEAMLYKHEYLNNDQGEKNVLLSLYKKAEMLLDSRERSYKMSKTAWNLFHYYDVKAFNKARRENGIFLIDELKNIEQIELPLKNVDEQTVPFYIPVFVKECRKELQNYLASNNVYATVIWSCPEEFNTKIDTISKNIYDEILCIPCDQRYCQEDMKYICDLIRKFFENI